MIKNLQLLKLENLRKVKEMKILTLKKSNLQTHNVNVKNQNLLIKTLDQDQGQYPEELVFKENFHKYLRI